MRWILLCFTAALAFAQGTKPKPAPSDYEVHTMAGPLDLGAEYMVHSYSAGEQMYLAERYLIVEVALYPLMKSDPVSVDLKDFALRVNHNALIPAQPPQQAAASLRHGAYGGQGGPRMSGGIGAGPIGIGTGQPRRLPAPPRAPDADPGGISREQVTPEEVLLQIALPEGPHKGAVSGFLYFPFTGKSSSIKTVELEYKGLTLKLK